MSAPCRQSLHNYPSTNWCSSLSMFGSKLNVCYCICGIPINQNTLLDWQHVWLKARLYTSPPPSHLELTPPTENSEENHRKRLKVIALTELIKVCLHAVGPWHWADEPGLQKGAPLVNQAAVASIVVLYLRERRHRTVSPSLIAHILHCLPSENKPRWIHPHIQYMLVSTARKLKGYERGGERW